MKDWDAEKYDICERLLPRALESELQDAIRSIYLPGTLSPETLEIETQTRPFWFRARYAKWLNTVLPLNGSRMLEIGAGTGTSTIAFAERGMHVTAIDIDPNGLRVAEVRARLHGVSENVIVRAMNAEEIGHDFAAESFDTVMFSASLEHMTHSERITSLTSAWTLVKRGGFLAVCDAPNRLWFFDNHTTFENFYHWLPDDLAARYAARSSRVDFKAAFAEPSSSDNTKLARWGRGVSYHDFEVSLDLDVRSVAVFGEWEYHRSQDPTWATAWSETPNGRYHDFLRSIAPSLPVAFLEEEIALAIRRPH